MNLVIFGPPGAGKGTQAKRIADKYNYIQVSTGDILRNEIENKTETGSIISEIINKGNFVNDELINSLIEKYVSYSEYKNRIIFDGYPRNINQAKNLENLMSKYNQKLDHIFFLNVNKDSIIERIKIRKILEKRLDDNTNTILKRYDTYMEVTKPVLDYYSRNQNFHEIDGSMKIDDISQKIEEILKV